ncbi:MAG: hypothetical protein FWG99_10490, partial [Treponema sp.]|nr:hypothetical protein [Treponema sp.]
CKDSTIFEVDWGLGPGGWGLGTGDWGLGTGDWGLGTGDWSLAVYHTTVSFVNNNTVSHNLLLFIRIIFLKPKLPLMAIISHLFYKI